MDIKLLKSDILSNNIPNFLIFNVEEYLLAKQYIDYISTTINRQVRYYSNSKEALYDIETNLKEDFLYIIYEDRNILSKTDEYFSKFKCSNRNIILYYNSLDKKSDFYKNNELYIVDFKKLDRKTLIAYAMKQFKIHRCTLNQDKLEKLIEYCNNDLNILSNELDKIFILEQENINVLVDYLLDNGFIDYRETNVFDFINLILNKDRKAFEYFNRIDESPVTFLINMFNMSKKRFISTRNLYYKDLMKLCYNVYCGVLDGTFGASYAISYILMRVFS